MARFDELLTDFFYRPDEEVGALFELGPATAQSPPPIEEEAPREYLAFALDAETYAIPIDRVRVIVRVPPLTEVPRSPRDLLGVINLRGEVLPVYDLKLRLQLASEPAPIAGPEADLTRVPRSARILIVQDDRGDAGILVDAVQEAVKLRPSTVEAPPRGLGGGERATVAGIGRRRDQLFILLDLGQALP